MSDTIWKKVVVRNSFLKQSTGSVYKKITFNLSQSVPLEPGRSEFDEKDTCHFADKSEKSLSMFRPNIMCANDTNNNSCYLTSYSNGNVSDIDYRMPSVVRCAVSCCLTGSARTRFGFKDKDFCKFIIKFPFNHDFPILQEEITIKNCFGCCGVDTKIEENELNMQNYPSFSCSETRISQKKTNWSQSDEEDNVFDYWDQNRNSNSTCGYQFPSTQHQSSTLSFFLPKLFIMSSLAVELPSTTKRRVGTLFDDDMIPSNSALDMKICVFDHLHTRTSLDDDLKMPSTNEMNAQHEESLQRTSELYVVLGASLNSAFCRFLDCAAQFTAGSLRPLVFLLMMILFGASSATGLRVSSIDVPRYLVVGQRAVLRCQYELGSDQLYSLTWWKDGKQFYQYIPSKKSPAVVFTVPGIAVNPAKSALTEVELVDVRLQSSGLYRCEVVADAPSFATDYKQANMTVLDTSVLQPEVRGVSSLYRAGDPIRLNCSAPRAPDPHTLAWMSRGQEIHKEHVTLIEPVVEDAPQQRDAEYSTGALSAAGARNDSFPPATPVLMLILTARKSLFPNGSLKITCINKVHEYQQSSDVTLQLDTMNYTQPHHLPTQQQTGGVDAVLMSSRTSLIYSALIYVVLQTIPSP